MHITELNIRTEAQRHGKYNTFKFFHLLYQRRIITHATLLRAIAIIHDTQN